MAKYYFSAPESSMENISKRLVMFFKEKSFEVMTADVDGEYLIQAKKASGLRTITGTNQAFKVKIYSDEPAEVIINCTIGEWSSNLTGAGIAAIFTGGITLLTGAAGVAWAHNTEKEMIAFIEDSLKFKNTKVIKTDKKGEDIQEIQTIDYAPPSAISVGKTESTSKADNLTPKDKANKRVELEIEKLRKAKVDGIITDDEFHLKMSSAQNKVDEYEIAFIVEESKPKLAKALEDGVLTKEEHDQKIAELEAKISSDFLANKTLSARNETLKKFKDALDADIITQEEYDNKVAQLDK